MSDIYNIVNLKIYLFYFVGLYFYLINLIGHGSIMMSKHPNQLKNINIIGRKLPENMYVKKFI